METSEFFTCITGSGSGQMLPVGPLFCFYLIKHPHVRTTHCRLIELLVNNELDRGWWNVRSIIWVSIQ